MNTKQLAGTGLAWLLIAVVAAACTKHECDLKTDAEKAELGELAKMTEGAYRCSVGGISVASGIVMPGIGCAVGTDNCLPSLDLIHGDGATVTQVADGYKKWLESNKWNLVEDEASQSKTEGGKAISGRELSAKDGTRTVLVSVYPFGDKLVQSKVVVVKQRHVNSK